jgi:hypothetical protein
MINREAAAPISTYKTFSKIPKGRMKTMMQREFWVRWVGAIGPGITPGDALPVTPWGCRQEKATQEIAE